MILGIIHSRLELSTITLSGVDEVPAKLVHPVEGSHFNDRTWDVVAVLKAQATRISPLWASTAVGYLAVPEESRTVAVPKAKPVMLFWASRCTVTGIAAIWPAAAPPSVIIRREVNDSNTAAGRAYAEVGVGDFTGTDQPPEIGSELAYASPILPELST